MTFSFLTAADFVHFDRQALTFIFRNFTAEVSFTIGDSSLSDKVFGDLVQGDNDLGWLSQDFSIQSIDLGALTALAESPIDIHQTSLYPRVTIKFPVLGRPEDVDAFFDAVQEKERAADVTLLEKLVDFRQGGPVLTDNPMSIVKERRHAGRYRRSGSYRAFPRNRAPVCPLRYPR